MKLLDNERVIVQSPNDKVSLSNYRIQMNSSVWGKSYFISIFLENISSIEVRFKSNNALLIAAVAFFVFTISTLMTGLALKPLLLGLFISFILLLLWMFSRKHVVAISSNGGRVLNFEVKGMTDEAIQSFIHSISTAKHARVNELSGKPNSIVGNV